MKRFLCLLLAALLTGALPALAEADDFFNSANQYLGDAWNSVSNAAGEAWNSASEVAGDALGQAWDDVSNAAGEAWDAASEVAGDALGQAWNDVSNAAGEAWDAASEVAGDALGQAWDDVSNAASEAWDVASEVAGDALGQAWEDVKRAAADAWGQAGVYLSEKRVEFSVWMSLSGSDALGQLKAAYDEMTAELGIDADRATDLWLQCMDYADAHNIARVTLAKLALATLACAQSAYPEGDLAQIAAEMLLSGEIADQSTAESALASLLAIANPQPDPDQPRYYLGEAVNTGKDNGYSGADGIVGGDPHFGWTLGNFFVSGYASVREDESGAPVFIKAPGEQVELWFQLNQDIDCLNGSDALSISEDTNAYDEAFGVGQTNFGRGALIVLRTDDHSAPRTPVLHADFLSDVVSSGANSVVQCFDEGDYEIALDYEIKDQSLVVFSQYSNYRIAFRFSVRNEN